MKSNAYGSNLSGIQVTNISRFGLWLLTRNNELFVSFKEFPQFQDASVSKIMHVEQHNPNLLHWPDLDISLALESVRCFPLMSPRFRTAPRPGRQAKARLTMSSNNDPCSSPMRTATERTTPQPSKDSAHLLNVIGREKETEERMDSSKGECT